MGSKDDLKFSICHYKSFMNNLLMKTSNHTLKKNKDFIKQFFSQFLKRFLNKIFSLTFFWQKI